MGSSPTRLHCPWDYPGKNTGVMPPPGDHSHPGIEPAPLTSPAVAGGFFTTSATWEVPVKYEGTEKESDQPLC